MILQKIERHHIINVHRKRVGDVLYAVDGQGTVYECTIAEILSNKVRASIHKKYRGLNEPTFKLTLAVGLTKRTAYEWVIEKGTELGVSSFVPVITQRSLMQERGHKIERWRRIALAAMKQCGRSRIPDIKSPTPFQVVLHTSDSDLKWLAHESANTNWGSLSQKVDNASSGTLLIGPEGGFTDEEVREAKVSGFSAFGMGPRRLRTETAAMIGAALILNKMGELN